MQNLYLVTILLVVVTAIVPVTFAADSNNCTVLTKQEDCCAQTDTDQTTKLCQFVKCNATDTGACYLKSEQQICGDANTTDSCPAAPAGSTTPASGTTQAPNSTAAPNPSTTQADTCTGKSQTECCVKDSNCQYVTCSGATATSGCYASNKNFTDICTEKNSNATNLCATSTESPATASPKPESSTNNGTTTPSQTPPTCDSKNQTACCAAKATCQFVNCTDLSDATAVHQGCHSKDEDLTKFCVNNTSTDLCATAPSTQAPTSSTANPTGGAPQPSKGGSGGKRQGFDAASFIGGIVLCAGIVAIIFFGLKFYKARTERNYHTLH